MRTTRLHSCTGKPSNGRRLLAWIKFLAVACIVACMALSLTGCKYTDVLTQHVEDPEAEADPYAEPVYEFVEGAPPNADMVSYTLSDSDNVDDQVAALPTYDPDAPDNGPTVRRKHDEQTPDEYQATEGEQESGQTSTSNGSGKSDGSNQGTGADLDSDEVDNEGDNSSDANMGGDTEFVDDQGRDADTKKGTIAAVGQYATITQMLGGAGGLVAADQAWFDSLPAGVFPGELDTVQVGWAGDGTYEGSAYTDRLINDIKPTTILWDGVEPALTADDRARLEEAGITIQRVPRLGQPTTEDADVMQAVVEVSSILSGVSTVSYDPIAMRDAWLGYHEQVLEACYNANGGYSYKASDGTPHLYQKSPLPGFDEATNNRVTVVYIDGWWSPGVSGITVNQHASTYTGTISLPADGSVLDASDGVATSAYTSSNAYMLIDYYLQFSGIVNNAYDLSSPYANGKRYVIMAGSTYDLPTGGAFASRSGVDSALWYNSGDSSVAANWKELGDPGSNFPAVFVNGEAEADIAASILASASKPNGLYHMRNPYGVYVVPSGVAGNWAYGTTESFLVAPWALRVRDESTLEQTSELVANYYRYFYRCEDWSSAVRNWDGAYTAQ